jgi:hypothetical protein
MLRRQGLQLRSLWTRPMSAIAFGLIYATVAGLLLWVTLR